MYSPAWYHRVDQRVNAYFGYNNYYDTLKEKVSEKSTSSPTEKEKKSTLLLEKVFSLESPIISIRSDNESFKNVITEALKDIASVKPGRKLLKQLIANQKKISIEKGEEDNFFGVQKNGSYSIHINPELDRYYFSVDEDYYTPDEGSESLKAVYKNISASLFHELVHFSHEDRNEFGKIKLNILKGMHDLEEQRTVAGISSADSDVNPISENGFLMAKEQPLRVDHYGIEFPPNTEPSLIDRMFELQLTKQNQVRNILRQKGIGYDPQKALCHFTFEGKTKLKNKNIYPFTAACYFGFPSLIKQFLSEVRPTHLTNYDDDLGGPIRACLLGGEFILAEFLMANLKIPSEQMTNDIIEWTKIEKLHTGHDLKDLECLISFLSPNDKCRLFKELLLDEQNILFVSCVLLHVLKGDEIDHENNTILTIFLKFIIDNPNKPLNYGYLAIFEQIIKLPSENSHKESALTIAQQLNDSWILEKLNTKDRKEEYSGNIFRASNKEDLLNWAMLKDPPEK